jgi:hypothetical protein
MNTPTPSTVVSLSQWQIKQAAVLYHFASLDYLKGLHRMVSSLVDGVVDPLLALAKEQNRDAFLKDPRWGSRNTNENWSNNAWPFLRDLQRSLSRDIADRAFETYRITDTNNCFRGIDEYSMQWATADEEQRFTDLARIISDYALYIDQTLDDYHTSLWSDYGFANIFREFGSKHPRVPNLRVRTDVSAESGKTPRRTGVYVAQDDPLAGLQFGWTGNGGGKLRPAKTFSAIGLDALQKLGRGNLWLDDEKMFNFAMQSPQRASFEPTIYMLGKEHRNYAAGAVAEEAFVDRPCMWYFVEIVNGEFQDFEGSADVTAPIEVSARISGGDACISEGFYSTPARSHSRRRFAAGEIMPNYESHYDRTIWQWDINQK